MAMQADEIERLIKDSIPDAQVVINDLKGDGDHYAAQVVSVEFIGKQLRQARKLRQGQKEIS
jgi:stress-induced morphogen